MAPLVLKQLSILLWKSWIIRKRHWISAIFEFIFPLLVVFLLVYPRYMGTKQYSVPKPNDQSSLQPPTYFDDKAIDYKIGELFQRETHIYYTPINKFTDEVMKQLIKSNQLVNVTQVDNEDQLLAHLLTANSYSNYYGLVFLNNENDKNNINFKIRTKDYDLSTVASLIFPNKMKSGPSSSYNGASNAYDKNYNGYDNSFSTIQIAVSEAYLNYISENRKDTKVSVVTTHQMPYPQYLKDDYSDGFNFMNIIGIIFVPAYIIICPLIVKRITDEKVAKAKEMLRMMGMSDWVFWGSHFINFFSIMFVQSLIITLLFFYGLGGLPYFLWSNGFLFFIAMILFNINTILSSMFLTTIFNRPVIAVVVSVILFEISQSVPMALLNPTFKGKTYEPDITLMALSCFLPNMAIQWVMTLMGNTELYGHGISWNNFWEKTQLYGNFTLGYVMLLMLLSIFFYTFLIWYIDNVWPFQYGIPKPFYYPFLPSYWLSNSKESFSFETKQLDGNPEYFEREPNMRVGIKCQNLQKIFNKKSAVNDVSLNIYSGQITVLLGHNGAGKTTTMNMITGIFPPSDGTAFIDGYDIRQQTKKARRSMALCPQENILYNELNVYEHLKLYAVLKDHPLNDVDNEVNKTLQMISLSDKRNALSTDLSGGMKRKLCLGIAIIANSQILVLDEPTSGMDPEARRHMWDVLQSIRSQRTILLTTHYMEEADALGDRIAIMNEGQVKCCGTPMFLKKTFGAGYHLRISKNNNFRKERVLSIIRNYMPNAEIKSEIHSEIIYTLESNDNNQNCESNTKTSSVLAQMFGDLESRKTELDVNSCGLTVTTMEDVFLRVGNEYNDNEMLERNGKNHINNSDKENLFQSIPKNTGNTLHFQQFKALLLKRFHYAKRYWPMVVLQSVLPAILFMCVLLLDSTMKDAFKQNVVNRQLTLKPLYGNTEGFVSFDSDLQSKFEKIYSETAKSEGVSTQVIRENPNNWALDDNRGKDLAKYIKTYLVGAQFNYTSDKKLHLFPWYNKEASQTLPSSINILYESLLKQLIPEKTSITVHNHPIPSGDSGTQIDVVQITLIISCLLLIPLTVPFIGASYVLFPVHERVSNSKLLQLMNGLSSIIFWSASYLFDIINHLFASIFIFIVFIIFDWNKVFWGNDSSRTALFFMIFLFGFASIPLAYLISLRLKKPSTGYALLVVIYLLTGLILVMALGILDMFINTYKYDIMSQQSFEVILFFARLFPVFAMSFGIQKIYKVGSYQLACNQTQQDYLTIRCYSTINNGNKSAVYRDNPLWGCCRNLCEKTNECYYQLNALNWDAHGVAFEFTCLIITGILYLLILWFIEENMFEKIKNFFFKPVVSHNQSLVINMVTGQWGQPQEDSDVFHEKQRINNLVNNSEFKEEAIVVKDLSKAFGKLIPIQAVNHLSFAVHKEECFGLLGVNGAGKTTTFRMLTGDESISGGNAWIENLNIRQELRQFQKQIGYCPQFDALLDKMTGTETLYMFCRLRGMPEYMISSYVNELVEMVDLSKHIKKRTETYSGGNRRKLSLAIALCAAPPVIFLDEPTSGVDPSARRKIWSTLAYLQEKYRSAFILTSHSMEECEALCSRLAIMVNGEFQCLGSVQHLRSKFGQGFTVMAKLRRDLVEQPSYIIELQNYFREQLPSAVLKDIHQCLLHYHITDTSMLWSKMFAVMEDIKTKYFLEDYIISDTTLEQIFLAFARRQR